MIVRQGRDDVGDDCKRALTAAEYEERIRVLEAELARSKASRVAMRAGPSVIVPEAFAPIFRKAEETVGEYFQHIDLDPTRGIIEIHGERYLLIRAAALSDNFLESVARLYADQGPEASMAIGREFLFDIAHIIGLNDARSFHDKMHLHDPVEKLSAGPVHFSHTGWALVDISEESRPSPDEDYYLIYDHPYSFEADSWVRAGKSPPGPVCAMNAGYSSGWCEESFGLPLTAVEVQCKARGDASCRFIMAPPQRIQEHVDRYLAGLPSTVRGAIVYEVPTFFDRKKSEELLKSSERRFRLAAQVTSDLIYEWDCGPGGGSPVIRWFGDIGDHLGHPAEEIGHDVESWLALVHPGDHERLASTVALRRVSTEPIFEEYRIRHRDDSWRILQDRSVPILDDAGRPLRWIGVCTDVTEQRQMESERTQASKLESLGVLAGGIAHDFNNMLSSVLANLDLALDLIEDKEVEEILEDCQTACHRTKDLTKQLLTFAKGGRPIREPTDVPQVIREATEFSLRGTNVKAIFTIDSGLPMVSVDPGQVGQVAQNISINAAQAMPGGGTLEVHIGSVPASVVSLPDPVARRFLEISFRDQGMGIAAENLERIFDPYFTTKPSGSGIGLATCFSIVRNHQGTLKVESEPGRGATFRIYLPLVRNGGRSAAKPSVPAIPGRGRILVMDDDQPIRKVLERLLHRLGYEVHTTASGEEAVAAYREARSRSRPFDAMILDLTIPGAMGGYEALQRILAEDPEAVAVVTSGYSETEILDDYRAYGFKARLQKPFALSELSVALAGVLGAGAEVDRGRDVP